MSSKSTIIDTQHTHIYNETDNRQYFMGRFHGFDVVWSGQWKEYDQVKLSTNGGIIIVPKVDTELSTLIGSFPVELISDVTDFDVDEEGFSITIKGGSYTAKKIENIQKQPISEVTANGNSRVVIS